MRATVVDAKSALIAQLRAQPDLAGVLVDWSPPPHLPRERERMFVHGVRNFSRSSTYEAGSRTETYQLGVLIEVHQAVEEQQPVETRVWELVDGLEDAVASDPELGAAVHRARFEGVDDFEAGPSDQGWLVRLTALVGVRVEV